MAQETITDELLAEDLPRWTRYWGIAALTAIALVAIPFAFFLGYADSLIGPIVVSGTQSPPDLVARSSGRLRLLVRAHEAVARGQVLALVGTDADVAHVARVRQILASIVATGTVSADVDSLDRLALGELAPQLGDVRDAAAQLQRTENDQETAAKIAAAQGELAALQSVAVKLGGQRDLLTRQVEIAEKKLQASQTLLRDGLSSSFVVADAESVVLQRRYAVDELLIQIANNRAQMTEKRGAIASLIRDLETRRATARQTLGEAARRALGLVAAWEQAHVVAAPIDGNVSLFKYWSVNQFVREGDEIMSIAPRGGAVVGRVLLSEQGAAYVKQGQVVRVRFDAYPAHDFGTVDGVVQSNPEIPREGKYSVEVGFPGGLKTSEGKTLALLPNMQGSAEIMTSRRSFFDRIVRVVRSID